MPEPLAICLEDLDARPGAPRYLRCVAVVGRDPGLRLDAAGAVLWRSDDGVACELWVSGDDQLILYRPEGAPASTVRRAGREVVAPVGKPVVLRDQDEVDVGGRHLRVHVHGPAPDVAAPEPLPDLAPEAEEAVDGGPGPLARAAAALALGAALGMGACVEVRQTPPDVRPVPQPRDAGPPPKPTPSTKPAPIEVRPAPPAVQVVPSPPPPSPSLGAPPAGAPTTKDVKNLPVPPGSGRGSK